MIDRVNSKPIFTSLTMMVILTLITFGCINHTSRDFKNNQTGFFEFEVEEAYSFIQKQKDDNQITIIDVRTPNEFKTGHIKGALNMNYSAEDFENQLDGLDKSRTYVIYCRSGSRSGRSFDLMKKLNFKSVYHIKGGMLDWQAKKLPTVDTNPE